MFSDNSAWGLFNFRHNVISHFLSLGYRISVCIPYDELYFEKFKKLGCTVYDVPIEGHGMNPFRDLSLVVKYIRLMRSIKPDISITYTIKPNLYAGIAASILHIPYLPIVPGAGQVFVERSAVTIIVRLMYRIAFRRAYRVWFLNEEDVELFRRERLVSTEKIERLNSEGIDLETFSLRTFDKKPQPFTFIFIGRLLREKGVEYYVNAARHVKSIYPEVKFLLLGMQDDSSKNAISRQDIKNWQQAGLVEYLGSTPDVIPLLKTSDCLVLPSYYREGVPRSLMEGAAVGLPIITTDNTGCREVVLDGVTGYLCRVKDAVSLADAMTRMIELPADERRAMGLRGRRLMEERFDVKHIIRQYDEAVDRLMKSRPRRHR